MVTVPVPGAAVVSRAGEWVSAGGSMRPGVKVMIISPAARIQVAAVVAVPVEVQAEVPAEETVEIKN